MHEQGLSACAASDALSNFASLSELAERFAASDRVRDESVRFGSGDKRQTVKQFIVKYQEHQQFTPWHPLYVAGLEIQPIVAAVLGPCRYISADLWYAIPNASQHERTWSQNWHRDPEADEVIKVMLYFREVDEEAGPFEYIAGSHRNFYDVCPARKYLPAGVTITGELLRVMCKAGTLAFANTSGLHRGGYTKSKPRLSCVWTYVPEASDCKVKFSLN